MQPRLTIGIPTLGTRPDRLAKAIGSALGQSVPVRVLVADQNPEGPDGPAVVAARAFHGHPLVRHVHTGATTLRENWLAALANCETGYFAWLQDDDVLAPTMGMRAVAALEARPRCPAWLAYLSISTAEGLGNRWQFTGPMIPMDVLTGGCKVMSSPLAIAGAYFASHALSPAVAIRVTPEAIDLVGRQPEGCDLFAERLVPALLATLGPPVCDPMVAGYWVQHDGNESRRQQQDGDRQYRVMLPVLDRLLDRLGRDWRPALSEWATLIGPDTCRLWLAETARFAPDSATLAEARQVLASATGLPADPGAAPVPVEAEPEAEAPGRKPRRRT